MAINPDYAAGQRFIGEFMRDTCVVSREPLQQFSGPLDQRTGLRLLPNTPTDPVVLYRGPCLFQRSQGEIHPEELGEELMSLVRYEVLLPKTAIPFRLRDIITVVSARDTTIVGHVMRVLDVIRASDFVYRGVHAQDMTEARSLYERD